MARKDLSKISTILEAKAYIAAETASLHDRSEQYFFKPLASLIQSLADLYREAKTPEGYQSHKIALAGAIDSLTAQARLEALPFAPCIFLLLKYGFAISEDIESSDIVRYRLVNALISIFNLEDNALTIGQIIACDNYLTFLSDAVRSARPQHIKPLLDPPVSYANDQFRVLLGQLRHTVDALLATVPKDAKTDEEIQALREVGHLYKHRVVARLEPVLNAKIQEMPQQSYDQKKNVAKRVNEELNWHGVAISCKVKEEIEGREVEKVYPAILVADTDRKNDEVGRFRLEYQGTDGKPHRVAFEYPEDRQGKPDRSSRRLPHLGLMAGVAPHEEPQPEGPPTKWADTVTRRPKSTRNKS